MPQFKTLRISPGCTESRSDRRNVVGIGSEKLAHQCPLQASKIAITLVLQHKDIDSCEVSRSRPIISATRSPAAASTAGFPDDVLFGGRSSDVIASFRLGLDRVDEASPDAISFPAMSQHFDPGSGVGGTSQQERRVWKEKWDEDEEKHRRQTWSLV
jgi:hypothetical protein